MFGGLGNNLQKSLLIRYLENTFLGQSKSLLYDTESALGFTDILNTFGRFYFNYFYSNIYVSLCYFLFLFFSSFYCSFRARLSFIFSMRILLFIDVELYNNELPLNIPFTASIESGSSSLCFSCSLGNF